MNFLKTVYATLTVLAASLAIQAQQVLRVDAVGITVDNMTDAVHFYTRVLPFQVVSEVEVAGGEYEMLKGVFGIRYRKVRLKLGTEEIELTDYLTAGGRTIPEDSRSNDLWFQHIAIVVSNMDSAYAKLRRAGVVHVSTAPQTLPKTIPAAEGIRAFYFRDPDGHNLELISYPQGKGDPRWQQKDKLFLGIDHTAIGISNTEASRKFYQQLGVTYLGESYNFGTEQEHLNNVFGAKLHITGNKAPQGFGVEFLEYESPRSGRPYPYDAKADDLISWETILVTRNAEETFAYLKKQGATFVSAVVVTLPSAQRGYVRGFYVRDPDGHLIGIFEKSN